ncbi:hypothetical protein [Hymenobacter arcticus]
MNYSLKINYLKTEAQRMQAGAQAGEKPETLLLTSFFQGFGAGLEGGELGAQRSGSGGAGGRHRFGRGMRVG